MEDIYLQIVNTARAHGATKVILFGSRARGTHALKSDIDIAVSGASDFGQLEYDIQNTTNTLIVIDVVDLDSVTSLDLLSRIAEEGRILYEEV